MNTYSYCVNTFKEDKPVQLSGFIDADSEEDAIKNLIDSGMIDPLSYEFLELYKWRNYKVYLS